MQIKNVLRLTQGAANYIPVAWTCTAEEGINRRTSFEI